MKRSKGGYSRLDLCGVIKALHHLEQLFLLILFIQVHGSLEIKAEEKKKGMEESESGRYEPDDPPVLSDVKIPIVTVIISAIWNKQGHS